MRTINSPDIVCLSLLGYKALDILKPSIKRSRTFETFIANYAIVITAQGHQLLEKPETAHRL